MTLTPGSSIGFFLMAFVMLATPQPAHARPKVSQTASATTTTSAQKPPKDYGSWVDYRRRPAFEVNVLWPLFPGGMTDLKVMVPVLRPERSTWRGELITGIHSDFGWRFVRDDEEKYGQVAILAAKLGYRQFFAWGLHAEAVLNAGWRHEKNNPIDGEPIHSFQGRLWLMAGYQHEFSRRFYANLRGGGGVHLWRTDRFADSETIFVPAGDINLGLRF